MVYEEKKSFYYTLAMVLFISSSPSSYIFFIIYKQNRLSTHKKKTIHRDENSMQCQISMILILELILCVYEVAFSVQSYFCQKRHFYKEILRNKIFFSKVWLGPYKNSHLHFSKSQLTFSSVCRNNKNL